MLEDISQIFFFPDLSLFVKIYPCSWLQNNYSLAFSDKSKKIAQYIIYFSNLYSQRLMDNQFISSISLKPMNMHWIRTGYKPYWKIMYCRQFSTDNKIKNNNSNTSFVSRPLRAYKTGINLIIFQFTIHGILYVIKCNKSNKKERGENNIFLLFHNYNNVFLFVGLTILGTFYWFECWYVSTTNFNLQKGLIMCIIIGDYMNLSAIVLSI